MLIQRESALASEHFQALSWLENTIAAAQFTPPPAACAALKAAIFDLRRR